MGVSPDMTSTPEQSPAPLPVRGREDPPPSWSLAVGLVAFGLYLALAPRTMGDGDAGEFTLVLAVAGVAHPPGYPLYTMLGHLWVSLLHTAGVSWARGASSWSALGGALAVAALHALAARLLPASDALGRRGRALLALLPCALFAFNPAWTREVTIAEVNSWHVALVLVMALVALQLLARADVPGIAIAGVSRAALGWGVLCGVALTHHLTAMFAVLPLTVALALAAWRAGIRGPRPWAAFAAGACLALPVYGWIGWRAIHPASYQWPLLEPSLASVLAHVRGGIYTVYLGGFAPSGPQRALLVDAVLPLLMPALGALAIVAWRLEDAPARALLRAALATCVLGIAFASAYAVLDPVVYFLPPLALSLAGIAVVAGWVAGRVRQPIAAAPVVLALAGLAWLWSGDALARARRIEAGDEALHARWRALPIEHGIVIWTTDDHVRLRVWQLLEGEHPGVAVVDPAMLTWPAPRRAFERRFGFDPLAGLELRDDSQLPLVGPNIARQTGLPVVDFAHFRP